MSKNKRPRRKLSPLLSPGFISQIMLNWCCPVPQPHASALLPAPTWLPFPTAPVPQRAGTALFSQPGPRAGKSSTDAGGEERVLTQLVDLNATFPGQAFPSSNTRSPEPRCGQETFVLCLCKPGLLSLTAELPSEHPGLETSAAGTGQGVWYSRIGVRHPASLPSSLGDGFIKLPVTQQPPPACAVIQPEDKVLFNNCLTITEVLQTLQTCKENSTCPKITLHL